jgi:hypothetical protein
MGVSHGRSRIADLAFRVFSRPIHPDWLAVREHHRVGVERWEADLRIVEGGHAVVFRAGPVCLTEILTGPETPLPEPGLIFHSSIRHERTATLRPNPTFEYQTCFEVERVDPEVFSHLSEEMALDASRGRLFHRFRPVNRMAPAPISHLRFEARVGGLTVHTFHSFPDERAIVRTQSLFEPR